MMTVDRSFLPKTGLVLTRSDKKVCAGWMYKSESNDVCWLGWITSNPGIEKLARRRAIEELILEFTKLAKKEGFLMLFAETNNDSLKKRYENTGFNKGDENSTQFMRRL